jgi:hypothetical protein
LQLDGSGKTLDQGIVNKLNELHKGLQSIVAEMMASNNHFENSN